MTPPANRTTVSGPGMATSGGNSLPSTAFVTGRGHRIQVTGRIAKGGQGEVYSLAHPSDMVFKRIFDPVLDQDPLLRERLTTMVGHQPPGWREATSGHVMLTWPSDLVFDHSRFVGFLMPLVDATTAVELHQIANPSDRHSPDPQTSWAEGFNWHYLVATAENLALAVHLLHEAHVVIGDFNERNVLVWQDARVTLLDCDSMQISNPATDQKYLCPVGRPEFTAPELHNADWRRTVRAPSSDLFALAIHLHQLLLEGAHPFDGVWHGQGDKPKRPSLARDGIWAYGGDSRLSPRPSAPGLDVLPKALANMFRRAFVDGATNPRLRPTAEEWRHELHVLRGALVPCPRDPQHWYDGSQGRCPWCAHAAATTQVRMPAAVASRKAAPPPPPPGARRPAPAASRPVVKATPQAAQTNRPTAPARPVWQRGNQGRLVGKTRDPWGAWLLSVFTLGLYGIWWYCTIQRELHEFDPSVEVNPGKSFLAMTFGWFLYGIPPVISTFRTGSRIAKAQTTATATERCVPVGGVILLIMVAFMIPYYQSQMNKIWDVYGNPAPGTVV